MIIPTVERWEAGDQPNETTFTALMNIIKFIAAPPEVHVSQVAPSQTIPQNTWTPVTWNTVTRDTEFDSNSGTPMWSAANPTRITIQTRGWYEIEFSSQWAAAVDTVRRIQALRQNGSGTAECEYQGRYDQKTASTNKIRTVYDGFFDVGSYIEVMVYQEAAPGGLALVDGGTLGQRSSIRMKWYSL